MFRRLAIPALLVAVATLGIVPVAAGSGAVRVAAQQGAPGGALGPKTDFKTSANVTLNGVGANSIQPLFDLVFYQYGQKNPKTTVNYDPAGSSVGITNIQEDTTNFGDSEIPLTEAQLSAAKSPNILQVPVALGGVAISYNLPGVTERLKLDGPTLAGIFGGTITNWDAPQIAAVTGIQHLPNLKITPVHRADSSGPSWDFDQYLIDTTPNWTSTIGTATPSTSWPKSKVGIGEQLNSGVASYLKDTVGSIGYLSLGYALAFANAAVKDRAGDFVAPSESSFAAAGAHQAKLNPFNFSIVYEPGAKAYPMVNFSWTLVYREQPNVATGVVLGKLLYFVVTDGQKAAGKLGYAPLPADVSTIAIRTIERLESPTGKLLFSS